MTQPDNRDIEAPEADVEAEYAYPSTVSDSIEAPEWDALEQAQVVPIEDDYR
jgi:hypothetical protein